MAKAAKGKRDTTVNPRSRAAKRATSPSINVDKSIKETPRASNGVPMLGATKGGGISKKRKVKQMTRGQRLRHEKGMARAEIVVDRLEKKVDEAKSRSKKIQQRRGVWNEINDASKEEVRKSVRAPGRETITTEDQEDQDEWEDVKKNDDDADDIDMGVPQVHSSEEPTTHATATDSTESQKQEEIDLIT